MSELPGVYKAMKKNGEMYYRSSVTYKNKHISLGSSPFMSIAGQIYATAVDLLYDKSRGIEDYPPDCCLPFEKWVILVNLRDNGIYFKNPIYLRNRYFIYYINRKILLKFDVDDLFYYANHRITKRGGYLFVSDYGMQTNILSRYGIKNFAVPDRDYRFVNGDESDYRYGNIEILNRYYGVVMKIHKGRPVYTAKIHINGDYIIGRYHSENEAAIAYNKAIRVLRDKGISISFHENYINDINEIEYARIYHQVRISKKIREFQPVKK